MSNPVDIKTPRRLSDGPPLNIPVGTGSAAHREPGLPNSGNSGKK